jgi:hypothetical protein
MDHETECRLRLVFYKRALELKNENRRLAKQQRRNTRMIRVLRHLRRNPQTWAIGHGLSAATDLSGPSTHGPMSGASPISTLDRGALASPPPMRGHAGPRTTYDALSASLSAIAPLDIGLD